MKKNKTVCHMTTAHPPFDIRIFHKQAVTLSEAGYRVILIAPAPKDMNREGVIIKSLPVTKSRFKRFFYLLPLVTFRALKEKAGIYHFHDPELIIAGLALKLVFRKKVIYDVHEDYASVVLKREWIPGVFKKLLSMLVNRIEKGAASLFDCIIAVTDEIENSFKNNKRGNVIQVRNYPKIVTTPPGERRGREEDTFTVVYAGVISGLRGIYQLVSALEHVRGKNGTKLVLMGRFESEDFKKELQDLPAYKMVDYRGILEQEEVWEVYGRADAGAVCLLPEDIYKAALPNKLFEYMAAGLPVIASGFDLWKEIVEGSRCGLTVDPLNPKEIAKAIDRLAADREEAVRMGENGRKAVVGRYNWNVEKEKLLRLYESII